MMQHDEMLDSVAVYALGALGPQEAAEVAAHLQSCASCLEEYKLLRPAVTAVGYAAEACEDANAGAVPSPLLKARLMQQVRSQPRAGAGTAIWMRYAVAACVALFVGAGLADLALLARIGKEEARLSAQSQTIADLAAGDSHRYPFANGQVLVHGTRLYLAMRSLPAPPPGKVYQAWTLPKGSKRMAPSLTFQPDGNGEAILRLPEPAEAVTAVAVSVEPAGGSQQPTSKPVAVVAL